MHSRFVGLDSAYRPESYPILSRLACQVTSSHSFPLTPLGFVCLVNNEASTPRDFPSSYV
jgi:hypothetical protein